MQDYPIQTLILDWHPVSPNGFAGWNYDVTARTYKGSETFRFCSSREESRERDCAFMRYILDDVETVFGGYAEPSVNSISEWLLSEGICDEYDNTQQRAQTILQNYNSLNRLMSTQDQKNLLWALRLMGF